MKVGLFPNCLGGRRFFTLPGYPLSLCDLALTHELVFDFRGDGFLLGENRAYSVEKLQNVFPIYGLWLV